MRLLLPLLLIVFAGCENPTGAEIPADAMPLDPPVVYVEWWADMEARTGISRPMADVRFFVVPGLSFWSDREQRSVTGRWVSDGRIYIAEMSVVHRRTVQHEMLHELLQGDNNHEHPLFREL